MFGKIITAMVTPFEEDGTLSLSKAEKLVRHLEGNGTDTILLCGTTGEGPTLTEDEKMRLVKKTREIASKGTKIIYNAGSNNTAQSIQTVRRYEKTGLVDGFLLVSPYYNKPSQKGLYEHFKAVANETNLPIILYNIPSRTSVTIELETLKQLADIPNIVGVKESSGDIAQMARIVNSTPEMFHLYAGDDNMTLPAVSIGARGVVSVASHLVGNEMKQMMNEYEMGQVEAARLSNSKMVDLFDDLFFKTNPVPIKSALNFLGVDVGGVRLPLVDLTMEENLDLVIKLIRDLPCELDGDFELAKRKQG